MKKEFISFIENSTNDFYLKSIMLFFIVIIISIPNFYLINYFNTDAGDYYVYKKVALNILNGCGVSLSNVGEECVPTFGGNHLPGYPFFLSVIFYVFGVNDFHKYLEALIFSVSIIYFVSIVNCNYKYKLLIIVILSISPIHLGWPRLGLTESLSTSLHLIFFTYCASCNRKNILVLALITITAIYIRLDNIILIVPGLYILYKQEYKICKLSIYALAVVSSLVVWGVRNHYKSIDIFPKIMPFPQEQFTPKGYILWGTTWITNEYERQGWAYPLFTKNYDEIFIEGSYIKYNPQEINTLIEELRQKNGEEFPEFIDNKFKKLAFKHIKEYPFDYFIVTPAKRFAKYPFNMYYSYGLPLNLKLDNQERLKLSQSPLSNIQTILSNFNVIFFKILANLYKIAIILMFLFILFKKYKNILFIASMLYVVFKWALLSYSGNIETRYLMPAFVFLECSIILFFLDFKIKKNL
jgi:hypothetical protein